MWPTARIDKSPPQASSRLLAVFTLGSTQRRLGRRALLVSQRPKMGVQSQLRFVPARRRGVFIGNYPLFEPIPGLNPKQPAAQHGTDVCARGDRLGRCRVSGAPGQTEDAVTLVHIGEPNCTATGREPVSENNLEVELRGRARWTGPQKVKVARLERSGEVSVLKREEPPGCLKHGWKTTCRPCGSRSTRGLKITRDTELHRLRPPSQPLASRLAVRRPKEVRQPVGHLRRGTGSQGRLSAGRPREAG